MVDFKVFGIKFSVSVGLLCVMAFMLYVDKTGYMPTTLLGVLLHEVGHIAALKIFGCTPECVELKIGAISLCGRYNLNTGKTAFMLFAGPIFNLLAAAICFSAFKYFGGQRHLENSVIMFFLGLFNLLPITGLDGGEITVLVFSIFFESLKAKRISKAVSFSFCVLLFILGVFLFLCYKENPSLLLFAIYLLICTFKNEY